MISDLTPEAAHWLRDPAGGGALDHGGAPAGGLLPGPGGGSPPPRCHGHGLSRQVRISRTQDTEIFQPQGILYRSQHASPSSNGGRSRSSGNDCYKSEMNNHCFLF